MHQRDETRRKKDWPTAVTGNSNVPPPQSHILCCLPVAAVTAEARVVEVEQLRLEWGWIEHQRDGRGVVDVKWQGRWIMGWLIG